jgi:hypothetical protein
MHEVLRAARTSRIVTAMRPELIARNVPIGFQSL